MSSSKPILVASQNPQQALLLAQFLMNNGMEVETCDNAVQALHAAGQRSKRLEPYHALLIHLRLPGLDAIELAQRILGLGLAERVCALLPDEGLEPGEETKLRNFGYRWFLNAPLSLNQVQQFLDCMGNPTQPEDDQPFFGTARLSRSSTQQSDSGRQQRGAEEPPAPVHSNPVFNQPPLIPADDDDPFAQADAQARQQERSSGYYRRQPGETLRRPLSENHRNATGGYERRSSVFTGGYQRQTSQTHRIRRSVTGNFERGDGPPSTAGQHAVHSDILQVRCAHCMQVFSVPRRTDPYNIVCVHCGKMNRILPA